MASSTVYKAAITGLFFFFTCHKNLLIQLWAGIFTGLQYIKNMPSIKHGPIWPHHLSQSSSGSRRSRQLPRRAACWWEAKHSSLLLLVDSMRENQTGFCSSSEVIVKGWGWWLILSGSATDWWSPVHPPSFLVAEVETPAHLYKSSSLLFQTPYPCLPLQEGDVPPLAQSS